MRPRLYHGGTVHTMADGTGPAEAVLTIGDRIAAVGTLADVSRDLPAAVERVDLDGGALLPAFIDAHGHFPDSALVERF